MVIPEKVEETVNDQKIKALVKGHPQFVGFSRSGIRRDHHIPQEFRMDVWKFTVAHGKSQHIGGALAVPVLLV